MKLYDVLRSTEETNIELVTVEEDRLDAVGRRCGLILRCPEGSSLYETAQSYRMGNFDVIKIGITSSGILRLIVKS